MRDRAWEQQNQKDCESGSMNKAIWMHPLIDLQHHALSLCWCARPDAQHEHAEVKIEL